MGTKYKKGKIPGIRYKEHPERKNGIQKDRYYYMFYQLDGKQKEEGIGWASQGWNEKKVAALLLQIKENIKLGKSPRTFKEMREMNEQEHQKQEKQETLTIADTITLQETYERYLKEHKMSVIPRTAESTDGYYRLWIAPFLAKSRLVDISLENIQDVLAHASQKLAPRSVVYVKAVLRQIFNFAKNHDLYFKDNPATKIKIKMKDNKRNRFLTREEARALLNELAKHSQDIHEIALMSLFEGVRAGSIFALQWKDVNFNINRLSFLDTKNNQSYFQPIHPIVKEMLQRRKKNNSEGYVFKSQSGGKIKELSDTYQRVVDKMGFNDGISDSRQKVVFHTLRHTYASWLVGDGVDLYTTQQLMGHKSNQLTQRYAHLAPEYLEKAVNSLERI